MSREYLHRYAVSVNAFAAGPDYGLAELRAAVDWALPGACRFHTTLTEAGEAVCLFTANRTKGRRLAQRLDDALRVHGGLSWLGLRVGPSGLHEWVTIR